MQNAVVVKGHLLDPSTVELDEPVINLRNPLEVILRSIMPAAEATAAAEFWVERSVEELAAEQGVTVPQRLDDLVGAGADLWQSDAELLAFVEEIRSRRHASVG